MLTFAQRQKFFAAAHSAYLAVRPAAPFDEWRQNEMELIGLPASTKQMDHVWHFERAMLHFAILSDDAGAMSYWGGCARRRLEWIFGGFLKDLAFLQERDGRGVVLAADGRPAVVLPRGEGAGVVGVYREGCVMPGLKFCNHQEECQLVLGAVEAKVKLQTELVLRRKEWEAKRAIMNSLYLAAVKLRKAQKKYFKTRAQTDLTACRVLESDFDELLDEIRLNASGHLTKQPIQPPLPNM